MVCGVLDRQPQSRWPESPIQFQPGPSRPTRGAVIRSRDSRAVHTVFEEKRETKKVSLPLITRPRFREKWVWGYDHEAKQRHFPGLNRPRGYEIETVGLSDALHVGGGRTSQAAGSRPSGGVDKLRPPWRWFNLSDSCEYSTYARRPGGRKMLPQWVQVLLILMQEYWSARRSDQIQFLKLQVELLRQKLPGNRPALPDPRPRHEIQRSVRSDVQTRRRRCGQDALPGSHRQLLCRVVDRQLQTGMPQSPVLFQPGAFGSHRSNLRHVPQHRSTAPEFEQRADPAAGPGIADRKVPIAGYQRSTLRHNPAATVAWWPAQTLLPKSRMILDENGPIRTFWTTPASGPRQTEFMI